MKQTAGLLRLELAQYRELAAFAQFASDLDPATLHQIMRGQRLMEVMKQGVHQPLPIVKQVALIYAGINGHLDAVPVKKVRVFEAQLYEALDTVYGDFVTLFNQSMSMTPEVKKALDALLADFKRKFRA